MGLRLLAGPLARVARVARAGLARTYSTAPLAAQFECPHPCPAIPDINVSDYCMAEFRARGDLPALVCGASGREVSFGAMESLARQFGAGLLAAGLRPGDRLAVLVPNCPEFGPVLFGALGVGVVLVPVSPLFTPSEVAKVLQQAGPRLVVTTDPLLPLLAAAQEGAASALPVVTLSEVPAGSATPFAQFTANDGSLYNTRPRLDPRTSLAVLPFSSGTTGPPKGVMLTHANLAAVMVQFSDIPTGCALSPHKIGEEQAVSISVIPMYHVYGLVINTMHALLLGAKVVVLPKFEPSSFLSCLAHHTPHYLNIVPPLVSFLAHSPLVTRTAHLPRAVCICSGGSPLSGQVVAALRRKVGPCELKEGYGLTETCGGVSRTHVSMEEGLRGTVGRLLPGMEARVEAVPGELAVPGEPGELLVRGPQVMLGYYNNPAATREVLTEDGWLRTGDVVTHDAEGNLTIVDRIKDMIKVKGLQVSPTEVEEAVAGVAGVLEAAVVGVPHPKLEEAPRAYVVRAPGGQVTEEEVLAGVAARLAGYKQLAGGVVFVQELPKSATGKVLRRQLRALDG